MADIDPNELDRADMERLVAGHESALNALMERHAAAVFRFLVRMLNNEWDANDLAQETFVRVFRARTSYRPTLKFTTWLYTIAANLARNQLRWRARHPAVSIEATDNKDGSSLGDTLPAGAAAPNGSVESRELADIVRAAVQQLPENLRDVLVLCEWEELSMAEAAQVLQTTPKAVDSRLYRARRQLREGLRHWLDQ